METIERLEKYFNGLDNRFNIRIQKPFPMNFQESGETEESDTYAAFFDKNGSTSLVEIVHYKNEGRFSVLTKGVKEVDSIDHVIIILDNFFKNHNVFK